MRKRLITIITAIGLTVFILIGVFERDVAGYFNRHAKYNHYKRLKWSVLVKVINNAKVDSFRTTAIISKDSVVSVLMANNALLSTNDFKTVHKCDASDNCVVEAKNGIKYNIYLISVIK
jgi:hypothetical protein